MKILVVEDNDANRAFLECFFTEEGYAVNTAVDGHSALASIVADMPSLIITDVLMPGMDGFQLLRAVRSNSVTRNIPVIFFTGSYLDQKDRLLAMELGVSRYLEKPMEPLELLLEVEDVLKEKKENQSPPKDNLDEPVFLKLYNERLVDKLKCKMYESEQSRLSLEYLMESIPDGVVVTKQDYTVLQVNSAAAAAVHLAKSDILGRKCFEVFHKRSSPCEGPHVTCPLPEICSGAGTVTVLHTHFDGEGEEHQIEIKASAIRNGKGDIVAMVETWRDVMDMKTDGEYVKLVKRLNEAQTHLRHMAITDELTGLRNRRYIVERLEEEFQRACRSGRFLTLIMLDIDHFKQINDAYGHLFGDVVLRVIAGRIKTRLRKHDLIGRVGGEEFLVVCPDSSLQDTIAVAERIRSIVNDYPISDGVHEVKVALSAGVAVQTPDDGSSDRLFSRADSALYKAKEEGRNRVVVLDKNTFLP